MAVKDQIMNQAIGDGCNVIETQNRYSRPGVDFSKVTQLRNMIHASLGDFGINKADIIVNILTQYIHDSGFKVGTKLPPERLLCEQFGVGARSLREALVILKSVGVIYSRNGQGWYVGQFDPVHGLAFLSPILKNFSGTDIDQIMMVRLTIEPMIAKLAAQNISSHGLKQLKETLDMMERYCSDIYVEEFRVQDRLFHGILSSESQNTVFPVICSIMSGLFYSMPWWRARKTTKQILEQHRDIYEAIAKSKEELAYESMANHIREAWKWMKDAVQKENQRMKQIESDKGE
jgi:GntR family transcriptional regulator, transcriptional repressor for pyruvate dehydrogenase complex